MEKPCCIGVVRDANGLKGKEGKIENLPYYVTYANEQKKKNLGVVVIHDIFGFSIPNSKYIVDHLAEEGFDAIVGNFYHTVGSWPEELELSRPDFSDYMKKVTAPEFLAGVTKEVETLAHHLKQEKGITHVGVIGFCWGGLVVANILASLPGSPYSAVVSLHGAGHDASTVANAKIPILFLTLPADIYFPEKNHEEIRVAFKAPGAVPGDLKVYEGVEHGFVIRGDFNNPHIKAKADEAMKDTVTFLEKYLKPV